jgi:hypothetical protein
VTKGQVLAEDDDVDEKGIGCEMEEWMEEDGFIHA